MPIRSGYHSRGYLPHIEVEGAAYFVTFRLADSLPRELVIRLRERRDDLAYQVASKHEESEDTRQQASVRDYLSEVDSVLDQNLGSAWLSDPRVASLVASALGHFAGERYELFAWCVMPTHVHAVLRPSERYALGDILHSWKSYTATAANRMLCRVGQVFWQHESFDHWIRDDADFVRCCDYTEENPVKAGLVSKAANWRWSSAFTA